MAIEQETKVTERGDIHIPNNILEEADIESGDRVRWRLESDGTLSIEIIRERVGAFDDFEPADMGDTNAVEVTEVEAYDPGENA